MSKFRQREIEVVPGQKCTFSPDPNVPIGNCYAVLAITNREGQENAYTIAVSCAANPYFRREWIKEIKSWIPAGSEQPSRPDDVNELDHTVTVYVAARTRRDVLVSIEVPESSTARAGRYPLVFDIREHSPERDALLGNREEIRIDAFVAPYRAWDCTLTPEEATTNITRRRSAGLLTVTNRGNDWLYCQISAKVNDPRLRVDLPTSVIAVPPPDADGGASERRIPVALRTTARSLRGPVIVQSLQLTVQPLDAPSIPALPTDWRGQPDAERPLNVTTAPATGTGAQTPQVNLTYRAIFQAVLEFFRRFFQRTFSTVRNGITTLVGLVLLWQFWLLGVNHMRTAALSVGVQSTIAPDGIIWVKSKGTSNLIGATFYLGPQGEKNLDKMVEASPATWEDLRRQNGGHHRSPIRDLGKTVSTGDSAVIRAPQSVIESTKNGPKRYQVHVRVLGKLGLLTGLIQPITAEGEVDIGKPPPKSTPMPDISKLSGEIKVRDVVMYGVHLKPDGKQGILFLNGIPFKGQMFWSEDKIAFRMPEDLMDKDVDLEVRWGDAKTAGGTIKVVSPGSDAAQALATEPKGRAKESTARVAHRNPGDYVARALSAISELENIGEDQFDSKLEAAEPLIAKAVRETHGLGGTQEALALAARGALDMMSGPGKNPNPVRALQSLEASISTDPGALLPRLLLMTLYVDPRLSPSHTVETEAAIRCFEAALKAKILPERWKGWRVEQLMAINDALREHMVSKGVALPAS